MHFASAPDHYSSCHVIRRVLVKHIQKYTCLISDAQEDKVQKLPSVLEATLIKHRTIKLAARRPTLTLCKLHANK